MKLNQTPLRHLLMLPHSFLHLTAGCNSMMHLDMFGDASFRSRVTRANKMVVLIYSPPHRSFPCYVIVPQLSLPAKIHNALESACGLFHNSFEYP